MKLPTLPRDQPPDVWAAFLLHHPERRGAIVVDNRKCGEEMRGFHPGSHSIERDDTVEAAQGYDQPNVEKLCWPDVVDCWTTTVRIPERVGADDSPW